MIERELLVPGDVEFSAADETFSKASEKRWLDTLLLPDMSTDLAVRLLQINDNLTGKSLQHESRISKTTHYALKYKTTLPKLSIINKLLIGSPINPNGKAAQTFRVRAKGENVLTVSALARTSRGKLSRYLRYARGETADAVAKQSRVNRTTIMKNEHDANVMPELGNALCDLWLKLPQESMLRKVILQRFEGGDA